MLERYSLARRPALFARLIIGMLGGAAARQNEQPTLHVVPELDVKRSAGTWYEIARPSRTRRTEGWSRARESVSASTRLVVRPRVCRYEAL